MEPLRKQGFCCKVDASDCVFKRIANPHIKRDKLTS